MEAYDSQDKEKGLFTFYREQAEEQDKIKQRKKQHIAKMRQLQAQPDTLIHSDQVPHKNGGKLVDKSKKQQQQKKQHQKQQPKPDTDKQHKQFQKKILQILQKHKYDRNKRRNLKLVMKFGENQDNSLKYHLEALMQEQNQINKQQNGNKSDLFTHKKIGNGVFERVALCPTNFEVELDENIQKYGRNIINRKIGNASTILPKRLDKLSQEIKQKQDKSSNASQILQRNLLLPKLNIKNNNIINSNAVCIIRQQYQSARDRMDRSANGSVPLYNINKIKSTKDRSLYVDSARYKNDGKMNQHYDNRIYPVFIESHQAKKCEQEVKEDKQKMFVEIIRKLKFK